MSIMDITPLYIQESQRRCSSDQESDAEEEAKAPRPIRDTTKPVGTQANPARPGDDKYPKNPWSSTRDGNCQLI